MELQAALQVHLHFSRTEHYNARINCALCSWPGQNYACYTRDTPSQQGDPTWRCCLHSIYDSAGNGRQCWGPGLGYVRCMLNSFAGLGPHDHGTLVSTTPHG